MHSFMNTHRDREHLGAETLRRIPNEPAIKNIITQRINHVCSVENFAYNM